MKGQETLLRALALLRDDGLPVRLEIAGRGSLEGALRTLATELGIGGAVRLPGEQPYPRLPEFYGGAALYLQSSRHEAQGMAVLEAAACGIPLVGTDVGVLPELSPAAAVFVPVGDHRALADAVSGLLRDPDRVLAMGKGRQDACRGQVRPWRECPRLSEDLLRDRPVSLSNLEVGRSIRGTGGPTRGQRAAAARCIHPIRASF